MSASVFGMASLVILSLAAAPERVPNPYQHSDEPSLGPAPVPTVEQMFWVEVDAPPEAGVMAETPEGVTLLDKTKPGTGRRFTRFYFRADRGMHDAEIVVRTGNEAPRRLPLTVRTYREDIEHFIKDVPGIDPSVRKLGRSYYSRKLIATARDNMREYPELAENLKAPRRFDGMTDQELWDVFPAWSVPRQCYGNWPCPKCGEAIFKESAYYPWKKEYAKPFKATCPLCGESFPSNDYANDDFTSGGYPDDGWGYGPDSGPRDEYHGWVAYYNHHVVWRAGSGINDMALRYLLFDDEEAAHRVGVLLARMAYVYPGMNARWQQVHSSYLRPGRALIDGNWERNELLIPALRAYDAVFDYLDTDTELAAFLHAKDPAIESPEDVRALIDTCLVQLAGWDWMRRELSGGNQGAREEDLAQFIVCANMPGMADRWLEELFTHAYNGGVNEGGFDDETLRNTLTREGTTLVAALGYAMGYMQSKSDMAEILSRVIHPKWQARCNLYDERIYPKFRAEYDAWPALLCAGQFAPSYGDSGGGRAARYPDGLVARNRMAYERAYRRWKTDSLARILYRLGPRTPALFEPNVWPEVQAHAAKLGPQPPPASRVLDGAGFVVLESRPGAQALEDRAAIALRYGYGFGHHHQDNLNVEMWSRGECVAPELGYPCWAHPMGNTAFVAHHCTGMIDRTAQYEDGIGKGALEMFAAAPEASFSDVSAEPGGFPNRMYRRAVCLADAPDSCAYLFDILRIAGGIRRSYCFHGPAAKAFNGNLAFGPASAEPFNVTNLGGEYEPNIVEPQEAGTDLDVWCDWACDESDVHAKLSLLGKPGRVYVTARCAKPDIPPLRYLFAEDTAADGASEFVALWEPHLGVPFIEKVERLEIEGASPGEFQPLAVRVTLKGGQIDTFLYTHDPDVPLRAAGIEFQGSFGYWSERNGIPRCLHLVNGRRMTKEGLGVTEAEAVFKTKVATADFAENIVTLEDTMPADHGIVYFRHGAHRSAYHINEVLQPRTRVRLDLNALIFRSEIAGLSEEGGYVVCDLAPRIPGSGGANPHGYYDGAFVTGEDFQARHRVTRVDGHTIYLDRPTTKGGFPDADGDGRRMAVIHDFGPGDEVTVYNSVFVDFAKGEAKGGWGAPEIGGI